MRRCIMLFESAARASAPVEPRILIVGGGPTGSLTAALLHDVYPGASITIVDKSVRGLGGRMSTLQATGAGLGSSVDFGAQYISALPNHRSAKWNDELVAAGVLRPLAGRIVTERQSPPELRNFVGGTGGMASIVRYVADRSEATVVHGCKLTGLEMTADEGASGEGLQWVPQFAGPAAFPLSKGAAAAAAPSAQAPPREDGSEDETEVTGGSKPKGPSIRQLLHETEDGSDAAASGGRSAGRGVSASKSSAAGTAVDAHLKLRLGQLPPSFHAVVITCPPPQVLDLGGDLPALLDGSGVTAALREVSYSSRYSLALFYSPADWAAVSAALPYAGRFLTPLEDDVVRFVAFDSSKRGVESGKPGAETCPAVLIHTSVEFGKSYMDTGPALVEPIILEHLRRVVPGLPAHVESHCHRWRYSQVSHGYAGPVPFAPDASVAPPPRLRGLLEESHAGARGSVGALLVMDDPPLVLAGDAFTGSHWDGCVESAERASELIVQALEKRVVATLT